MLTGCLVACSSDKNSGSTGTNSGNSGSKKLNIVTTIFPEYDWVMNILGSNPGGAEVTMLLDNGVDLHSYQPTAGDILKVSSCDMFIYVGGESDEWVQDVLKEATNKDMVVINLLDVLGSKGYAKHAQTAKGTIRQAEQTRAEERKNAPNVEAAERAGATVIPETSEHAQAENITGALEEGNIQDATKYSYESLASAGGFVGVERDGERYFVGTNGERIKEVTSKQVMESPIGTLLNYAAEQGWLGKNKKENQAALKQQAQFFADILTLAS